MHRCCKYLLYYNNITVTVILIHHLRRNSVGETVVNKPKDKARRTMLQDVSEVRSQKFCGQGVRSEVGYRDASASKNGDFMHNPTSFDSCQCQTLKKSLKDLGMRLPCCSNGSNGMDVPRIPLRMCVCVCERERERTSRE